MSEAELTAAVVKLCGDLGLHYHHCPNSSRCTGRRGLPDFIILGHGGLVLAELKSADGNLTVSQHAWLRCAARAGIRTAVWRPADLESGSIAEQLRELA